MRNISQNLKEVLDNASIERIEIEIVPARQRRGTIAAQSSRGHFRWKLWSGGRLALVLSGSAIPTEIDAMIEASQVIVKTTLGINPNGKETPSGICRN
jgi:hypothetical protein